MAVYHADASSVMCERDCPIIHHHLYLLVYGSILLFLDYYARTTRARSAQFRLRRDELPYTRVVQILPAAQTTRTRH